MKILIDTQIILWVLTNGKLHKKEKELINNSGNEIICSSISLFEISLEYSIGKLELHNLTPDDIPDLLTSNGYTLKNVHLSTYASFYKLPNQMHKDPFDRILIWEAVTQDYYLMTRDKMMKKYVDIGLKLV